MIGLHGLLHSTHLLVAAVSSPLAIPVTGAAWQEGPPAPRSCHAMTYSPRQAGMLTFGGARVCGRDVLPDSAMWLWQGAEWTRLPGSFPGTREDAMMVFDSHRGVVVLYGGRNGGTVFEDTWEWDGTLWRRVATAGPGRVEHAAAVFDAVRRRVVLFGGGSRGGPWPRGTWEWDGTRWAQVDITGPATRVGHSMAPVRGGGVLLYGGFNEGGMLRDLWQWDGRRWTMLDSLGPLPTEGPALVQFNGDTVALVAARSVADPNPPAAFLVIYWIDGRWVPWRGEPGPTARTGQGLAYDPVRRRIVLYGGVAPGAPQAGPEVWEFDGASWHRAP